MVMKAQKRPPNLFIGTSGWSYPSWRGPFFPPRLAMTKHLAFYAEQFPTTELNGVFYRTPSEDAVSGWVRQTPDKFVFAWKASKFITHWKRLKETSRNSLDLMESRLNLLGAKAGPVIFQLPHRFEKDTDRLVSFLTLLSTERVYAFEFRHPSWYSDDVFTALADHGVAFCISDHHQAPSPWVATTRHLYVRAHGPGGRYRDRYPGKMLAAWAKDLGKMISRGQTAYVYFDNDQKSAAPKDAARFMQICDKESGLRVARPTTAVREDPKIRAGSRRVPAASSQ
jgi:uncharacterized protein YecE (DUF72 family)